MISNMWKSFLIQFLNTGLIILVVKMRIEEVEKCCSNLFIFTGKYSDLDPNWYRDVGVTIIFYMVLNIFTPHFGPFITYFILICKRCSDRSGEIYTSKKKKKEFIELYIGPYYGMGTRYAQMLTTIFVVLLYSSGIPILYVCCFLFFFLAYLVDKFLILRFYRRPPNINLNMTNFFENLIILAIILHYLFAIWIYGEKDILINKSITLDTFSESVRTFLSNLTNNNFFSDLITRATYPYNILCLIYFCFMILFFICKIFLWKIILKLFFHKIQKVDTIKNITQALPVRTLYMNYQVRKCQYKNLIKSSDVEKTKYLISTLKKNYFENNILKERVEILNRLGEINVLNQVIKPTDEKYDDKIISIWKRLDLENKNKNADIKGETSYNIAFNNSYRDESYFEYYLPFQNK